MARVDFYQLTRDPAPRVAATIAAKALATGARMVIVTADAAQADGFDAALWTEAPTDFLPHGRADDAAAAADPILIARDLDGDDGPPNGATACLIGDGVWRDAAWSFERVFYLFDGARIDDARAAWRLVSRRENATAHYWRQDQRGRWSEGP